MTSRSCGSPSAAPEIQRVCRGAWHVSTWVFVRQPGNRRVEGDEKGKAVIANRGTKEAHPKGSGR